MFNAGRKEVVLDKFGVWAPHKNYYKKEINESFKISFCGCTPMNTSGCLINMTQIYV